MKTGLILFVSLFFTGLPPMVVLADEGQVSEGNVPEVEKTSSDRSADSKSLFEGRCQMCHQLPEPGMLRPKQWRLILGTMQQRMQQAGVPPLTEEETEIVLEYIAEQSR